MKYKRYIYTTIDTESNEVVNLLNFLSTQLSDGYWENIDDYFYEFWNWLDFHSSGGSLVVKVMSEPCWQDSKDIFDTMRDFDIIDYIRNALATAYADAPELFDDGCFVERTIKKLFDWQNKERAIAAFGCLPDNKLTEDVHKASSYKFTAKGLHDAMDCSNISCEKCDKHCSSLCRFERLADYINGKIG